MNPCYNGVKDSRNIRATQTATAEIQTCTTKTKMTTRMMKKKKGKLGKGSRQVETSPRGHQTRQVEQGPWTPLERAAHE